ncbi:hypothetical protein AB4Z40_27245 [Bosea sp. 2YAB26]|uniref:hypothetical protein n=1 Tax=Bosea sp. 2YAB26 TaxID=3237478 RepID=UPI003F90ABB3
MRRSEFKHGQKWRVVHNGFRLYGMRLSGPNCYQSWSMVLPVGTVLTCAGIGASLGGDVPMIKWLGEHGEALNGCGFKTTGSIWSNVPVEDFLERVAKQKAH